MSAATGDALLVPAFRIGITGTRRLDPTTIDAVTADIRAILSTVRSAVERLVTLPDALAVYRSEPPVLRLLSALAAGADQLVADLAIATGYQLDVALPFATEDYAADFTGAPEVAASYRRLLAAATSPDGQSRVLELDGGRGAQEAASYEAVGLFVVRNCDLLIAVWDGEPARGRGGTADIVRHAARSGPPIWVIDPAAKRPPRLVESAEHRRHPQTGLEGPAAADSLAAYLQASLLPPSPPHEHPHGLMGWLAGKILSKRAPQASLLTYLQEPPTTAPAWTGVLWCLERQVMLAAAWAGRLASRVVFPGALPLPEPLAAADTPALLAAPTASSDRIYAYWHRLYERPDQRANVCAERYRSSFVAAVFGAALALVCAVVALSIPAATRAATTLELALLVGVTLIVVATQRQRWQQRWIAYRLLAELCRKQEMLAVLGWSLPLAEVIRVARGGHRTREAAAPDAAEAVAAWVSWLFSAAARAAPLAAGRSDASSAEDLRQRVLTLLVLDQLRYQTRRFNRCTQAAHGLATAGELLFLATLILVGLKTLLLWIGMDHEPAHSFGMLSAILAAPSAAFVGLRAYAELEIVASQSATMIRVLSDARVGIEKLALDGPLASQRLGAEVFDLAAEMLQDVDGWARLFRVKAVEAG